VTTWDVSTSVEVTEQFRANVGAAPSKDDIAYGGLTKSTNWVTDYDTAQRAGVELAALALALGSKSVSVTVDKRLVVTAATQEEA